MVGRVPTLTCLTDNQAAVCKLSGILDGAHQWRGLLPCNTLGIHTGRTAALPTTAMPDHTFTSQKRLATTVSASYCILCKFACRCVHSSVITDELMDGTIGLIE